MSLRPQVRAFFEKRDRMATKAARKPVEEPADTRSREEIWHDNANALLSLWPEEKSRAELARRAKVSEEYLSRLADSCPKGNMPSKALIKVCKVLWVDPASMFDRKIRILRTVVSAGPFTLTKEDIERTLESPEDEIERSIQDLRQLNQFDRRMVLDLIARLSEPAKAAHPIESS